MGLTAGALQGTCRANEVRRINQDFIRVLRRIYIPLLL